jgi:hypothetical protein
MLLPPEFDLELEALVAVWRLVLVFELFLTRPELFLVVVVAGLLTPPEDVLDAVPEFLIPV